MVTIQAEPGATHFLAVELGNSMAQAWSRNPLKLKWCESSALHLWLSSSYVFCTTHGIVIGPSGSTQIVASGP